MLFFKYKIVFLYLRANSINITGTNKYDVGGIVRNRKHQNCINNFYENKFLITSLDQTFTKRSLLSQSQVFHLSSQHWSVNVLLVVGLSQFTRSANSLLLFRLNHVEQHKTENKNYNEPTSSCKYLLSGYIETK